jgi:hypothetical protein
VLASCHLGAQQKPAELSLKQDRVDDWIQPTPIDGTHRRNDVTDKSWKTISIPSGNDMVVGPSREAFR